MRLLLKLLTIVYTIIFSLLFAVLFLLCIAYNSFKPDALFASLGQIDYEKIIIKDFNNDAMNEKYGPESSAMDMLIKELTDEKLSKEDATKLINNENFKKMYFESAYASLTGNEVKLYTDVELKKEFDSLNIKNTDYKRAAQILNEKASEVKIKKYENNAIYKQVVSKIADATTYTLVFIVLSYLLLAVFTLSMTKPMQLVGYPIVIVGTISICFSILMRTLLNNAMAPAYKEILVPLFKTNFLKYGIIAIVIGMILAITYEILSRKKPDNDKDLYSFTVAPQVNSPSSDASSAPSPQTGVQTPVAPVSDNNVTNNQIS